MAMFEVSDDAFNLELMKICGFYYMFDPNVKKIFNLNVYRLLFYAIAMMSISVLVFGTLGFFVETHDTNNVVDTYLLLCNYTYIYFTVWKLAIIFCNANKVREVFDVTRLDFMTSKRCHEHLKTIYESRDRIKMMINIYINTVFVLAFQWLMFPLIISTITTPKSDADHNKLNIYNFMYPVSVHKHNQYYIYFYFSEMTIFTFILYGMFLLDMFIIPISYMVVAQYEVLTQAYKNIGHCREGKQQSEHYDDLKSILFDQQRIYLKLKSFYSIARSIILLNVGLNSSAIIFMTYVFIVGCFSYESVPTIVAVKVCSSQIFYCLQLYFYCYFLGNINQKAQSVNFAIYSCNWTMMDFKFKKLVLLAIRMNDANHLTIKASPKKIVDLQLFASVMTTCYNILSVLLKKTINEK